MPLTVNRFTASGEMVAYGSRSTAAGERVLLFAADTSAATAGACSAQLEDEEAIEVATFLLHEVAKRMPEPERLAVETFLDTLAGVTQGG